MKPRHNLIMLNMSYATDWQRGLVNRNYHVLFHLLKSNYFSQVVSVDFLPFNFKKKMRVMLHSQPWLKNKNTVIRSLTFRVDKDESRKNFYKIISLDLGNLPKILRKINFPKDNLIIWSYDPFAIQIFELWPRAKFIFDAVDNWIEHPSYYKQQQRLAKCYEIMRKKSHLIFTVSTGLVDFFGKISNVFYIPNGVDVDHFSRGGCEKKFLPFESANSKIIGYHGIIQSRINFNIIEYLAQKNPNYSFVIFGPVWKEVKTQIRNLRKYKNIYFPGPVSYFNLPKIIKCFHAAIIPHKVDAFTQSMNPLKVYEYLAAGLEVITTPFAGSELFQDLIKIAISPKDFTHQLELSFNNASENISERRRAFAREHGWESRVKIMLEKIEFLASKC